MKRTATFLLMPLATLTLTIVATPATAQTYTDLYNFDRIHGASPGIPGFLAQGRDGNLYGTTSVGGSRDQGVGFRIAPTGAESVLYSFDCSLGSCVPASGLTLGTDGKFYGTSTDGGSAGFGTIFRGGTTGDGVVLYSFTGGADGSDPYAPPIEGSDGNFYGTTDPEESPGTAYRITPSGVFTLLSKLPGDSFAPLLQAGDGNFYGTTWNGGSSGNGTVFRMTPEGTLTVIHNFDGLDGSVPGIIVQGSDSNLYGTTQVNGTYGEGVVFKITTAGDFSVLYNFGNLPADGTLPHAGLVQATDGNFYGVTELGGANSGGVIFQITPAGAYSVVYNLLPATGKVPQSTPMQHSNGMIYGTAQEGGSSGYGVVYSLDMGLAPFVKLVSTLGKVGQTGGILGQGFTGTTSVSLNGIAASFTVVSDTYIRATVPAGATTGYVTVTTPSGTLTSNVPFRVLP